MKILLLAAGKPVFAAFSALLLWSGSPSEPIKLNPRPIDNLAPKADNAPLAPRPAPVQNAPKRADEEILPDPEP